MSNFNNFTVESLKWFVYVGTGHVGPLSAEQLREGYLAKSYTPQHYVWSQVMKDWQPMQSIPELMKYLTDVPGLMPPPLQLDQPETSTIDPAFQAEQNTHEVSLQQDNVNEPQSKTLQIEEIVVEVDSKAEVPIDHFQGQVQGQVHGQAQGQANGQSDDLISHPNGSLEIPENPELESRIESTFGVIPEISPLAEQHREHTKENAPKNVKEVFELNTQVSPQVKQGQMKLGINRNNITSRGKTMGVVLAALGIILMGTAGYLWWKKQGEKSGVVVSNQTGQTTPGSQTLTDASSKSSNDSLSIAELKMKVVRTIPALGKWLSPLPPISDLAPEDYERLKSAILKPLDSGASIEVALSTQDRARPSFYLASNLPNKSEMIIHLIANPDTLLGSFSFQKTFPAVIENGIAKTSQMTQTNGSPILPGEYALLIAESNQQPEAVMQKLSVLKAAAIPSEITSKPYLFGTAASTQTPLDLSDKKMIGVNFFFLGGTKDSTYDARIKEFHDQFKLQYESQLQEIKQTVSFLTSQWADTRGRFKQLKAQRATKIGQKGWAKFHATWSQMDQQIKTKLSGAESISGSAPELGAMGLFTGTRQALTQFSQAVSEIHEAQNGFFLGQTDAKKVDELLIELNQKAEASQKVVSDKISLIDGAGQSPSGIPILPTGA